MASLMPPGKQQYFAASGAPLTGGKLYTYAAGTSSPLSTYSDKAGVTPNTNPVILDARGEASIFWGPAGYKAVLKDVNDVLIWTQDNLFAVQDSSSMTFAQELITAVEGQTIFNLNISYINGSGSIAVYCNGLRLPTTDYMETSSTRVTMNVAATLGDEFLFVVGTLTATTSNADLVSYVPAGIGAVATTVQSKLRETISVKDFGAVGDGVTNSNAAFALAEAEADEIYLPAGIYVLTAPLTKKYFGPGVVVLSGTTFASATAAQDIGLNNTITGRGAGVLISTGNLNTLIGAAAGRNITTGTKNVFLGINGGSGNAALPLLPAMTGSDNIGIGFHAVKKCQDGSFNVGIGTDAGNEITTGDSNTCLGGSAGQQITIGNDNTVVGRSAALRLGTNANAGGTPGDPATWVGVGGTGNAALGRDALRNGYDCDNNTAIGCQAMRGTQSEATFTGNITGNNNVAVGYRTIYTGPTSAASNVAVGAEAGRDLVAGSNNVIVGAQAARDTEGSGNIIIGATAYRSVTSADNKLVIANQSGTAFIDGTMAGALNVNNILTFDALVRPGSDNTRLLGTGSRRWAEIFAANITINTSDARLKDQVRELSEVERAVAIKLKGLMRAFKWKDSVAAKGDGARIHFGVMAQEVEAAFASEGLRAADYALFCWDEWPTEFEPITEEREVSVTLKNGGVQTYKKHFDTGEQRQVQEAGNRYGIRYEELLAFVIAAL